MRNFMKFTCVLAVAIFAAAQANATMFYSDTFSYADGPITNVSLGNWGSFSGASPVNVSNGTAIVAQQLTQDVAANLLGSPHSNDVLYAKFEFNFDQLPGASNATSYFFMFKDGGTANFLMRTFGATVAGDPAGTFHLGVNGTTGGSPLALNASPLSTGVWYTAVLRLDQSVSINTPVINLWINPTLESDPSALTTGSVTRLAISTVALRQATTEGRVNIDNLNVADNFVEALTGVPEPSTMVMVGAGLLGLWALRRRRS